MRISTWASEEGYKPDALYYEAYLDGKKISKVITADEEEGYIKRYKTDENGNCIRTSDGLDLETEELYGDVEIKDRRL